MKIPLTKTEFYSGETFTIANHVYALRGDKLLLYCGDFTYCIGKVSRRTDSETFFYPDIIGAAMILNFDPDRMFVIVTKHNMIRGQIFTKGGGYLEDGERIFELVPTSEKS